MILGLVSCVEDKGNYSYSDINEIFVDLPRNYARVYLADTIIRIEPQLSQSLAKDESNLSFLWKYSNLTPNSAKYEGDTISTERYVDQVITNADAAFFHHYWLEITDKSTGLVYPFYTTLSVIKPFVNTWTILHAEGNSTKLGAIEYLLEGDPIKHPDVFEEFGYAPLKGAPVALGANLIDRASILGGDYPDYVYNAMYLITTDADESGVYAPWLKFSKYIAGIGIPQMVRDYSSAYFDVSKVIMPYKSNSDGGIVINDGRLFQGREGLKWYEAKIAPEVTGNIHIAKALRISRITIMYDDLGKRFLWYNSSTNGNAPSGSGRQPYTIGYFHDNENTSTILEMARPVNTLNLNDIQHRVLHIGVGYKSSPTNYQWIGSYAIANGQSDGKTYIYLFSRADQFGNTGNKTVTDLKEFDTPAGLNENSCFASSGAYNNIAFYSSGSSVYLLDFSTGAVTKIYEHSAGGTIVKMEMARQEPASNVTYDTNAYGFAALDRSLGIAINRGASGELAILNLNEAGSVVSTTVFDEFGSIKDICFLSDIKK
jgi:hypothetical protein